jgi:regulator of sigma E protease
MIVSTLAFIAVFTIVVLVHEFGHFLAARKADVKIYEFSIGFPFSPKIVTLFRHRETEFTLRLLPLGGFVSFSKHGDEEAPDLFGASFLNRGLILSAGSLFNVAFAFLVFVALFMTHNQQDILTAMHQSADIIRQTVSDTVALFMNILSGRPSDEGLAGPVGIAVLAGKAASKGFFNLAYFTGILSLSLGITNLIPFPALDGGQLIMLGIEVFRRKPLSLKTHQIANAVGFGLFIALTLFVTYKDVVRLTA